MRKILFMISMLGILLYTCSSPAEPDFSAMPTISSANAFNSSRVIGSYTLSVTINTTTPSITIDFGGLAGGNPLTISSSTTPDTVTISATGNNIIFNNGVVSGGIKVLAEDQIKVSFRMLESPYTRMEDVICKTDTTTTP